MVDGVGEVVAESITAWFADEDNLGDASKSLKAWVLRRTLHKHLVNYLVSAFVVTGTLETMGREEIAEKVRSHGGTFQSAVGKDTTYLVTGGKVGGRSSKAESYGTKIISEKELLELLGA